MKSNFLIGILLGVILSLVVMVPMVSAEKKTDIDDFKALNDEIHICNLLTGLYLSEEQVAQITPLATEAGKLRENFQAKREEIARKNTDLLSKMKKEIMETGDASPESKKRHGAAKDGADRLEEQFKGQMADLNKKVQNILTDNQRMIVAGYKPCIVPIQSISNPERIGSASDNDHIIKALSKAREISDEKYPEMKERFLSKIKPKLRKHFTEKEIPTELDIISKTMDEARAMSDEEFELNKNRLADKIKPEDKDESGMSALERKIDKFLLNTRFVGVAKEKIETDKKAASSGKKPVVKKDNQASLDSIPMGKASDESQGGDPKN